MESGLTSILFDVKWFKVLFLLTIFSLLNIGMLFTQNVMINEVMSSNNSTIQDEFGDYPDWIELYNTTSNTIELTGYYLSDDPEELDKWVFPNIFIEAHQFLLIYASGMDTVGSLNLHTNFKVNSDGEPVFLSNADVSLIDEMDVIELGKDISYGRKTDGGFELEEFYISSPGNSNNQNTIHNKLSVSHDPGFYSNQIHLSVSSSDENSIIHYTQDGTEPTLNSPIYNNPLLLSSREGEDYTISGIPTTPLSGPWQLQQFIWIAPTQSINLLNALRIRSFTNNLPSGDIFSGTYLIEKDQLVNDLFPILSIITHRENLFNYDTGIYIPGKRYELFGWENWHPEGNFMNNGIEWERSGHVEFFETDGSLVFSQDCGIRIHGGWSAKMPQKSLRIIARDIYGEDKFKYQIFPEMQVNRYKDFVLRNSGNDFIFCHFRDAFMQELLIGLDLEFQAFRPSVLFLNGEYWGFHGIRERYNEDYFKRHFEVEEEELIIVGVAGNPVIGDNSSYFTMMDFIRFNSPAIESNFDSIQKMIDIPNLTDYYIAQIYYANFDWPSNNVKMWKTTSSSSKWRFLMYDLDGGFGFKNHFNYNMLEQIIDTSISIYHPKSTELFRYLIKNDNFKEQFINRFVQQLKTIFHKDYIINVLNNYETLLEAEMVNHINRWNYPNNLLQWKSEIQILKDFATYRPCYSKDHLMDVFDLEELDFDCTENDIPNADQQIQVEIYPNPAKDNFYLTVNKYDQGNFKIHLYSPSGQQVFTKTVWLGGDKIAKINIDHLSAGMYFLNVTDDSSTINTKIIIE